MATRNWKDLRQKMVEGDPDRDERIRRGVEQLRHEADRYEHTLTEVRKAFALTQEQLARSLEVSQAQVSRIEHQTDLYLSTLQSYLEAMGGRLEVVGVFDDEEEVRVPLAIGALAHAKEMA